MRSSLPSAPSRNSALTPQEKPTEPGGLLGQSRTAEGTGDISQQQSCHHGFQRERNLELGWRSGLCPEQPLELCSSSQDPPKTVPAVVGVRAASLRGFPCKAQQGGSSSATDPGGCSRALSIPLLPLWHCHCCHCHCCHCCHPANANTLREGSSYQQTLL